MPACLERPVWRLMRWGEEFPQRRKDAKAQSMRSESISVDFAPWRLCGKLSV
jgi:hypothetical protein